MSDLLKEAIADAKAVRETALENAKIALQEAFAPQLKSMLSAKLAEDDMEDEDDMEVAVDDEELDAEEMARYGEEEEAPMDDMEMDDEVPTDDEEVAESEIIEIDGVKYAPVMAEEEEDEEEVPVDDEEMGEDLDLEAVIKELENEIAESEESEEDLTEGPKEDEEEEVKEEVVTEEDEVNEEKDEEEEDEVKEVTATEEDPSKGQVHEQVEYLQSELNEYKEAVTFLRDKLHEVNILNAKLLYTNRIFKENALTNEQKLKVVETFDRAQTTREIKLVYSTLAESMKKEASEVKNHAVQEAASRKAGSTKPNSKKIITEESEVATRFKKLAGILKN